MLLITGGEVHDGQRFLGQRDVLIEGDRIRGIGHFSEELSENAEIIDASGCVVCPGLIDLHNMTYELEKLDGNDAVNLTAQGITTCLAGNCGQSGKIDADDAFLRNLDFLKGARLGINIGILVGHNSLRQYVLADGAREATAEEIEKMCRMVAGALEGGALGLSTGLMYAPGNSASPEELRRLVSIVGRNDKLYTTHVRDEGDHLEESVQEALSTARAGDARLVISHVKAAGVKNWGKTRRVKQLIDDCRENQEVYLTYYPYDATSTVLSILIRREILENVNGDLALLEYRREDDELTESEGLQNLCPNRWDDIVVVSSADSEAIGRSLGELARASRPYRTVLDLLHRDSGTRVVFHNIASEEEIFELAELPYAVVVSDAYVYPSGACEATHPRNYGAFARVLKHYAGSGLEEILRKATSLAADILRLPDRGRLQTDYFADVAIFRPQEIRDLAVYLHPCELAEGVTHTIVNGAVAFCNGRASGNYAGHLLR